MDHSCLTLWYFSQRINLKKKLEFASLTVLVFNQQQCLWQRFGVTKMCLRPLPSGLGCFPAVDWLFNFAPIVCGSSVFGVLFCSTWCPFLFCNHLDREERERERWSRYFICVVTVSVLWLFFAEPWVALQCVIVVITNHIHLLKCI